jgi:hypothetical protein
MKKADLLFPFRRCFFLQTRRQGKTFFGRRVKVKENGWGL